MFRFTADIAGSALQTEDFGLDNVCLREDKPTSMVSRSWGRVKSTYR